MIVLPTPAAFTLRDPVIATLARTQIPPIPAGFTYGTVTGPDSMDLVPRSPVLRFEGCTYWAFSFCDGREAMGIVAYTSAGVPRQGWLREGARCLWDITVDSVLRTVTFHGQRRSATREPGTITMTWDELVPLHPIVSRRPLTQMPVLPPDLVCGAASGPDTPDEPQACPVLRFGELTYWALNFRDKRMATAILACDAAGRPVSRWNCDGARNIWQITSDPVARTVTFHGQRLQTTGLPGTATLTWDELWIG